MNFRDYFLLEVAKGLKDLQFYGNTPSFQVKILDGGTNIHFYTMAPNRLGGKSSTYSGGLDTSECFNDTRLLPPYKLFAWHSDINDSLAGGFGPFLYDIAMEIATVKGGYLISHAFVNRLIGRHLKDDGTLNPDFHKMKGGYGGDPTDEAEAVYQFYFYKRKDVESTMPNLILSTPASMKAGKFESLPEQTDKPYLYQLYRKQPTTLNAMIELNKQGKEVLLNGMNDPIMSLNHI